MQDSDQHQLTADLIRQMESHTLYKPERVKEHYNSLATSYDDVYLRAGYPDPEKVADAVADIAIHSGQELHESQILDFGCGTGLVGKALHDEGFRKIDGIDVSPNMIAEAKHRGVYQRLDEVLLC